MYAGALSGVVMRTLETKDFDLLRAAAYTCGAFAEYGSEGLDQGCVRDISTRLAQCIMFWRNPANRMDGSDIAVDNAVSALLKIAKYFPEEGLISRHTVCPCCRYA